jgi:fructose-bisphosphate aldolase class II
MLDLSEEPLHENIEICADYFEDMAKLQMMLEIELGVTGGEEDGVDNSDVDAARLYTQPDEVAQAYEALFKIGRAFHHRCRFRQRARRLCARQCQTGTEDFEKLAGPYQRNFKLSDDKPVNFVFHGGSGSSRAEIREALSYGAIKMNIDTDLQWALWDGIRKFENGKRGYLQSRSATRKGRAARTRNSMTRVSGYAKARKHSWRA